MARSLAPRGQLWPDHEQADPFQSSPSRVACPATSCPLRSAVSVLSYTRYADASFRTARRQKSVMKTVNREMICKRAKDGNRSKAKTEVLRKRPDAKFECTRRQALVFPKMRLRLRQGLPDEHPCDAGGASKKTERPCTGKWREMSRKREKRGGKRRMQRMKGRFSPEPESVGNCSRAPAATGIARTTNPISKRQLARELGL